MYLSTSTRPDISYAVGYKSRFVSNPFRKHCGSVKRVLRYLSSTRPTGIRYTKPMGSNETVVMTGYCDSDWGNDSDSRKVSPGSCFGWNLELFDGTPDVKPSSHN